MVEYNKSPNPLIDLIRGICILYIVGYWHLFNYTDAFPAYNNPGTKCLTIIALSLFIFLSGYILAGGIESRPFPKLAEFYRSRFIKIYPPFAMTAIAFWLMRLFDFETLLRTLGLVFMFWAPFPPTIWFIGMIMLFYAIMPVMISLTHSGVKYTLLCAFFFIIFLCYSSFTGRADDRVLLHFPTFATAIWIARRGLPKTKMILILCGAITLLSPFAISKFSHIDPAHTPVFIPTALSGTLFIFLLLRNVQINGRIAYLARTIAVPSYMIFLTHRIVFAVMEKLFFPHSPGYQVLYLFFVCLPLTFVISIVLQNEYDAFCKKIMIKW